MENDLRTLLVVDDAPSVREMVRLVLSLDGYRVIEASDGLEALEQLEQEEVDLVLSDINMPRLDGQGLVRALRQRPTPQANRLPIIMLSTVRREERPPMDVQGWLLKPFNRHQLLEAVNQQLGLSVSAQPNLFELPERLTANEVAPLQTALLDWMDQQGPTTRAHALSLLAHRVREVDAAGVQLLAALATSVTRRGWVWQMLAPSDDLTRACQLMGFNDWVSSGPEGKA
jgi:two-component system, chemotaxis family, chemotaxis protein CheY